MPELNPRKRQPPSALAYSRTRWGVRFFGELVAKLPRSAPPAERRLIRWVYTVYRVSDATIDNMTDPQIWTLGFCIEGLKATASEAEAAGVDECYVRGLVGLAFIAAREVLEIGAELVGPEEMFREEARRRREQGTP
jgi:hypothetical protein